MDSLGVLPGPASRLAITGRLAVTGSSVAAIVLAIGFGFWMGLQQAPRDRPAPPPGLPEKVAQIDPSHT